MGIIEQQLLHCLQHIQHDAIQRFPNSLNSLSAAASCNSNSSTAAPASDPNAPPLPAPGRHTVGSESEQSTHANETESGMPRTPRRAEADKTDYSSDDIISTPVRPVTLKPLDSDA